MEKIEKIGIDIETNLNSKSWFRNLIKCDRTNGFERTFEIR